ncbi:MAG: hypothetical protein CR986_03985 [Ignavibacteriae bacterium]|nr:MAG: hypothetical protein CR986_03985 [Ignavibacteriota bacterium]
MYLIFMFFALFMQAKEEGSLVEKLQHKFNEVDNLYSDFQQQANNGNFILGKFYFAKENKYRIELPKNIIISDGKSIKNKDLKRKKIILSNIEDDPLSFSLREYIYDYPEKCKVTEYVSTEEQKIILESRNNELNFKSVTIWVSPDYLISKIIINDWSGSTFILKFDNIKINTKQDLSLFEIKEEKYYKTIDLR